ncbi:hypothetical protein MKW92_026668 [Papaver armeniacum]|nr:hypothetical protein MKW92_026668 [Papaver armeniacum]
MALKTCHFGYIAHFLLILIIKMKNHYFDTTGSRKTTQVWDYSSPRPIKRREEEISDFHYSSHQSVKRRRREEEEIINYRRRRREIYYSRPSNRRREESRCSRRDISLDIDYGRRCSRRDISLDIDYGRSSNKKGRREESSGRREDINNWQSSSNKKRRREDSNSRSPYKRKHNISLNLHSSWWSSNGRGREDSSNNCSVRSVVIKEDTTNMISSSKSFKFYEEDDETNATPVGSFPCFVDGGIVMEILSRVPAKSLLRFKSVCKHWLSLIKQDQHFIHLHSIHSKSRPNLLCIAPDTQNDETETVPQHILTANLSVKTTGSEEKVIIHNVKKTIDNWLKYDMVLGPVNGLVCLVHWKTSAVRMYNVSTREITPWIKSTLLAEEKDKLESEDSSLKIVGSFYPIVQFGFDPEEKEHKVFFFWRLSAKPESFTGFYGDSDSSYARWEALTVGRDTKWRRISVVPDENNLIKINEVLPHYSLGGNPVHANGTIYWRNKLMACARDLVDPGSVLKDLDPADPDVIIAFDVGNEKFRVIPIPSFILDEPREATFNRPFAMLILGGRVTLIYQMSSHIVKLWMLDDDGVEKRLENCQGKGSSNWSAETITLPFTFDLRLYGFHGVPTSADKILISRDRESRGVLNTMGSLYSYDRKTKTSEKIEMDGIFSSLPALSLCRSLFTTTFTESLIPVQQPQQDKIRQSELV